MAPLLLEAPLNTYADPTMASSDSSRDVVALHTYRMQVHSDGTDVVSWCCLYLQVRVEVVAVVMGVVDDVLLRCIVRR